MLISHRVMKTSTSQILVPQESLQRNRQSISSHAPQTFKTSFQRWTHRVMKSSTLQILFRRVPQECLQRNHPPMLSRPSGQASKGGHATTTRRCSFPKDVNIFLRNVSRETINCFPSMLHRASGQAYKSGHGHTTRRRSPPTGRVKMPKLLILFRRNVSRENVDIIPPMLHRSSGQASKGGHDTRIRRHSPPTGWRSAWSTSQILFRTVPQGEIFIPSHAQVDMATARHDPSFNGTY